MLTSFQESIVAGGGCYVVLHTYSMPVCLQGERLEAGGSTIFLNGMATAVVTGDPSS